MTCALTADTAIAKAMSASGMQLPEETSFRPGLERFVTAFWQAKHVTQAGRSAVESIVVDTLIARLRMEDWIARHPRLLDAPVEKPVFIVGLPRVGTTLLFNLLALDKQRRVYWNWESAREIPPVESTHLHDDPRIARKVAEVDAALACGTLDHRLHVEMGNEPTECTFLLAQDFKSNLWYSQTQVPEYVDWLYNEADMVAAYRYQRRAMQVLQSSAPGKWTAKLPSHAPFLQALLTVFADARIVMTHRDPTRPLASSCAASRHFLRLASSEVDPVALGRETMGVFKASVNGMIRALATFPHQPVYHYHYQRFVSDPIAEIRRLYQFLGDNLSHETETRMLRALQTHEARRNSAGPNPCRLEEFGLSRPQVEQTFGDYMQQFAIERE